MGYRSDVIFACVADAVPIMLAEAGKNAALKELLFANADEQLLGDYDSHGSYLFRWSHVKWYDGYPQIQAFNQMIEKIEEKLDEEAYRWVCIGEELEDNEIKGFGFGHIHINRDFSY
tara:strand:+ start:234 stop:584 length:351 start_codon:yes stop_codon:yes gene_type:complete